jgi:D-sedoheptulose 7-phosphate isomerase
VTDSFAQDFIDRVRHTLSEVNPADLEGAVQAIKRAYEAGKAVFVMGNGGSAASASHLACDLRYAEKKHRRFRVVCLNDNTSLLTALANDLGYEEVFKGQLQQLVNSGDVVIALSVSGDSENIVKAAEFARQKGAVVVGFFGSGGGRARASADLHVTVSDNDFPVVESVQSVLTQVVAAAFRKCVGEQPDTP